MIAASRSLRIRTYSLPAARPLLPAPLHTTSLRSVATNAIQLVRDTRNAARQLREPLGA